MVRTHNSDYRRWFRRLLATTVALWVRVRHLGTSSRSIKNAWRILREEGFGGIRDRISATAFAVALHAESLTQSPKIEGGPENKELIHRILVTDHRIPRGDVSAGEMVTLGILRDLVSLGYEVVFLPTDLMPSPKYELELKECGIQVITRDSGYRRPAYYVLENGASFGVIYIMRLEAAEKVMPVIRRVAPSARIIFHALDLYFLREMRGAKVRENSKSGKYAVAIRSRELAMMRLADRIVVVSPIEEAVLRQELPDKSITIFPALYTPVVYRMRDFQERENIFFLGGFGHEPNVDAVEWFSREIWPLIRNLLPSIEFWIIGSEVPRRVAALSGVPGINVVGFIEQLHPVLETLRIGVAPLRYGAGIKGKVALTMGAGIPCVCTDIAAEGMGIENGVHALIENNARGFANAVANLYSDSVMWDRLSRNGQALVREKFSGKANHTVLLDVLGVVRSSTTTGSVGLVNRGESA